VEDGRRLDQAKEDICELLELEHDFTSILEKYRGIIEPRERVTLRETLEILKVVRVSIERNIGG
jgi:hypothetical protein